MFCPAVPATAGHIPEDRAGPFAVWEVEPYNKKRSQVVYLSAWIRK